MGWERWLIPSAEVIHHGGQSTAQMRLESFRSLWLARHHLYARYHSRLTLRLTSIVVRAAMRRRAREARSEEEREAYEGIGEGWR